MTNTSTTTLIKELEICVNTKGILQRLEHAGYLSSSLVHLFIGNQAPSAWLQDRGKRQEVLHIFGEAEPELSHASVAILGKFMLNLQTLVRVS